MSEVVNKEEELQKLEKELQRLEAEIKRSTSVLANKGFVEKAPKEKVEEEKNKLINYQNSYDTLMKKKKEFI